MQKYEILTALSQDKQGLSTLLQKVEELGLGVIVDVDFDDGLWEVKVCDAGHCQKLYLTPSTGEEIRRKNTKPIPLPPSGAKSIISIVQSIEAQGQGIIREVKFDEGVWEAKLIIDPQMT